MSDSDQRPSRSSRTLPAKSEKSASSLHLPKPFDAHSLFEADQSDRHGDRSSLPSGSSVTSIVKTGLSLADAATQLRLLLLVLVASEHTYVAQLQHVVEHYTLPSLVLRHPVDILFHNLRLLAVVHRHFYSGLLAQLHPDDFSSVRSSLPKQTLFSLCRLVISFLQPFAVYREYYIKHASTRRFFRLRKPTNKQVQQLKLLVQRQDEQNDTRMPPLKHLLEAPMHRLQR